MRRALKPIYIAALAAACVLSLQILISTLSNWAEKIRVAEAVNFALSLERKAIEEAPFKSRADLEKFFRQGFSEGLAADMARFDWPHGSDETHPLPSTINVLILTRNEAVAYYETPETGLEPDRSNQYSIQRVRKEDGRWIIYEVSFSTTRPSF